MAKRRKFESGLHPSTGRLEMMTYKDLKRECVIRGMPFDEVIEGSHPRLAGFFQENFFSDVNTTLLDEYDDYIESIITKRWEETGATPIPQLLDPSLRLGYIGERDEEGNVITRKKVRGLMKKPKRSKERTSEGIFKGTKKAYTFELQKQGLEKSKVIKMVIEKFPEASEKSVGIWFNKSKKLVKPNGKK